MTAGFQDLGAFCVRVARFDPSILVRVDAGAVWAMLPFDVLATRPVSLGTDGGPIIDGATYRAAEILNFLSRDGSKPRDRSIDWRGGVPPLSSGTVLEEIPAADIRQIAAAAADTLRQSPPGVGERRVRDALLDHIAITVIADGRDVVPIPLRLILGLTRMNFVGDALVKVCRSGGWIGLVAEYGAVWYRRQISLHAIR